MRSSEYDNEGDLYYHGINVNNYYGQDEYSSFDSEYLYNSNALFSSSCDNIQLPQSIPHQDFPVLNVSTAEENKSEKRLGLQLTASPSFLNLLDNVVSSPSSSSQGNKKRRDLTTSSHHDHDDSTSLDKLKAANFPALTLQIGSWKRESRHEGDLVAKCYFKKRKLVWEALEGNLKVKIEFQWSDISAIKAKFLPNGQGILDIMIRKSPLFFHEVNPQPRKHTNWETCEDFTDNNQASLVRRHTLEFAPGILEKQYEKLMQADPMLRKLSQQPFPYQASPYFEQIQFSNDLYYNTSLMNTVLDQFPGMSFTSQMSNYPNYHDQVDLTNQNIGLDPFLNQVGSSSSSYLTPNHLVGYQLPSMNNGSSMGHVDEPVNYELPQVYDVSTQMIQPPLTQPYSSSQPYDLYHQSSLGYQSYRDYEDGRYQWQ